MLVDAHQMTIPDIVEENARRFADKTAFVGESVEQRTTFSELPGRMCALAAGLRAAGVRRNDCVASLGMNSVAVFEAFLATSALGAVLAPLNWRQTDEELRRSLRTAKASFTLFDPEWAHLVDGPGCAYGALDELRSAGPDRGAIEAQECDPALRLLTAAFTGEPHAADLSQRALLSISVQQIIVH